MNRLARTVNAWQSAIRCSRSALSEARQLRTIAGEPFSGIKAECFVNRNEAYNGRWPLQRAEFCSRSGPTGNPIEILPLPKGISGDRMQMFEIAGTEGTFDGKGLTSVFAVHGPPELWTNQEETLYGANGGCFAVFEAGGTQHKVTTDNALYLNRIVGEVNEQVVFDRVLLIGSVAWSVFGRPYIPTATVVATIEEQTRSGKVIVAKFKKRKGYRRRHGHRQNVTRIRINEIQFELPDVSKLLPLKIELDPKRPPLPNSPRFL